MKEEIAKLQSDVVELTRIMKEKSDKGQSDEVRGLSEKLADLTKLVAERKHSFAVETSSAPSKEVEKKMDELLIASAICVKKDGSFDRDTYAKVTGAKEYADVIKASGFTVDANSAGGANTGADFIPVGFSSQLLEEIFLKLEVANLFSRINMPNSTYTLPYNPKRLIARAVAEAAAPTKDKAATDKIVFTANKLMSNVEFTDEFEIDSIIVALPFIRKQLIDGFALAQEMMVINGDKGTNIYAAAITGEDARKYVKGIRADAMATSTTVDAANAAMTDVMFRSMRTAMGKYGKAPSDLAYVVNMATYNKMLAFTGYQALYQYAGAVTTQGELGRIDNIPIIVSELLPNCGVTTDVALGNDIALGGLTAAGKFDAGGAQTWTSSILVNKNAYSWGDRNTFALETFRNPFNQTLNLVGSQRLDFEKVLASTDKTSCVTINQL